MSAMGMEMPTAALLSSKCLMICLMRLVMNFPLTRNAPFSPTSHETQGTDYKIASLDYIIDAYHPDTITYYDDIATERDLFMSPDMYRELVKPHHKRFAQACIDCGIIPIYHCCGHAEAIVEDMIDCGWVAWSSVQISNDVEGLIKKYGDHFGFVGGFDSNGPVAREDATPELVDAEVVRCLDTYGKYHRGYCFFGFRYPNSLDPAVIAAFMAPIAQKATEYSFELMMAGK